MATRLVSIVIDARDPLALGRWWSEVLSWPVQYVSDDEVVVEPDGNEAVQRFPALVFVPVPEAKTVKNRMHLDLASESVADQHAIVERLVRLGATHVDIGQTPDVPWIVLADPEGNELCVLEPRDRYRDGGPIASIVLDVHDPRAVAPFWVAATGWRVVDDDERAVTLRAPHGRPPEIDLLRVPDAKVVKNRLHLDVAPYAGDDKEAEVRRLLDAGATRVDVGQGDVRWTVLADPEGDELCVLSSRGAPPL